MMPTKKHKEDVKKALRAARSGKAYHWPTIAAILADEVERLRETLDSREKERDDLVGISAQAKDAIDWLLTLKNIKDTQGKTDLYVRNLPKAWANAKRVYSLPTSGAADRIRQEERERALMDALNDAERPVETRTSLDGKVTQRIYPTREGIIERIKARIEAIRAGEGESD